MLSESFVKFSYDLGLYVMSYWSSNLLLPTGSLGSGEPVTSGVIYQHYHTVMAAYYRWDRLSV